MAESDEQTRIEELANTAQELRWTVARLQLQLQQTRSALLGAAAWVFGLVLAASIFAPIIVLQPHEDDEPGSYSMVRVIGAGFGAKTESGGTDGGGLFIGACYLVLLLVVVLAIYRLRVIVGRRATRTTMTSVTSVVLLLGTAGALLLALISVRKPWWQLEPGIYLLAIGAAGFAVLALWSKARSWWTVPVPGQR